MMQLAATRWLGPVQRSGSSLGCCLVTLDCCFTPTRQFGFLNFQIWAHSLLQLRDSGLCRALLGVSQFHHTLLRYAAMTCSFKFHFLMFSRLAYSHAIRLVIKRGAMVKSQESNVAERQHPALWPNWSHKGQLEFVFQLDLRNKPIRPIPTSFVLLISLNLRVK